MRLYLDLCAIQRPKDDRTRPRLHAEAEAVLSLLALCESGALTLTASGVHDTEDAKNPHPHRRAHVADVLALAVYLPTGPAVLRRAAEYERAGIRRFDALHLATAVEAGVEYFCTTDDALLRKGKVAETGATSVVSPLELVVVLD